MKNTTQKIGAGILATAIVSAIALTSATHAANANTPSQNDNDTDAIEHTLPNTYEEFVKELTDIGLTKEEVPTKAEYKKELELEKLYNAKTPDMKKIQALQTEIYGPIKEGDIASFEEEIGKISDKDIEEIEKNMEESDEYITEENNQEKIIVTQEDADEWDKDVASITDEQIKEIEKERNQNKTEEEKLNETITESDWETLSMKQIDDKLVAAGLEKIGDEENDPHYTKTPAEIAQTVKNISASDWAAIEADMNNIDTENQD